jgi:hypothetical protein
MNPKNIEINRYSDYSIFFVNIITINKFLAIDFYDSASGFGCGL